MVAGVVCRDFDFRGSSKFIVVGPSRGSCELITPNIKTLQHFQYNNDESCRLLN